MLSIFSHQYHQRPSALAGLGGKYTALRQANDGAVWLVAEGEKTVVLYKYEGNLRFRQAATSARLRIPFHSIACDPQGNVWWSTNAEGLRLFSPEGDLLHAVSPTVSSGTARKCISRPYSPIAATGCSSCPKAPGRSGNTTPENGRHDVIADKLPSSHIFRSKTIRAMSGSRPATAYCAGATTAEPARR